MRTMRFMRFNDRRWSRLDRRHSSGAGAEPRGELLIRIHAAGVTPTELRWYPTTHTPGGGRMPGAIPGHEFSGVVEAWGRESHFKRTGGRKANPPDWDIP